MSDGEGGAVGHVELGAAAEATIEAYHQLAIDPEKRLHMSLDDTCLQFLSLVIGNGDNKLVSKAMDVLESLAESTECRFPMASTFGVLHCLKASVEEENDHTDEIKTRAAELFTCLNFAYHQQRSRRKSKPTLNKEEEKSNNSTDASKNEEKENAAKKVAENELKKPSISKSEPCLSKEKSSSFKEEPSKDSKDSLQRSDSIESTASSLSLSSCSQPSAAMSAANQSNCEDRPGNKYYRDPKYRTKLITLYVKGMQTPHERQSVEKSLVRVRGVISMVFDPSKSRIACRVRRVLDLGKLGAAVDSLQMRLTLYQIVYKNQGDEVHIPLSKSKPSEGEASPKAEAGVSDGELPEYLPEEDDECVAENDPNSAVANSGVFKEAATSFFSAAASLLQQSFYW